MVSSLTAVLIAATSLAAAASQPEQQWESDYGKALAATRKVNRPLLVVIDKPSDEKARLGDKLLNVEGEYGKLLKSYELCHVDAATEYGRKVAQSFGAKSFPHTSIIDKTGAVVLFKKAGVLDPKEWKSTLAKYESGQRQTRVAQTTFYRGGQAATESSYPTYSTSVMSPSYCPSCQRNSISY